MTDFSGVALRGMGWPRSLRGGGGCVPWDLSVALTILVGFVVYPMIQLVSKEHVVESMPEDDGPRRHLQRGTVRV